MESKFREVDYTPLITDRRRFYISEKGGTIWDHMDEKEKSEAEKVEKMASEMLNRVIRGIKKIRHK